MKGHFYSILVFVLLCFCQHILGQDQLNVNLSDLIETLQEDFPELVIDQEILEELNEIVENPIPINSATKEELKRLPFLTDKHIENLHYYIYQFGPMISLYELKGVEGFDRSLIKSTLPFVSIVEETYSSEKRNYRSRPTNELLIRSAGVLQTTAGFQNNQALGSPVSCLFRNKFKYKNYTWIFVSEKDVGESFVFNKKPEFISSSLQYTGSGIVRKVLLGDYKVHFAQGLIQSSNLFNRKSSLIIPGKGNHNLRYSSSADGGWFKRGAALSLSKGKLNAWLYGSCQRVDATIYTDTIQNYTYFKSMQNGGFHRTLQEYSKRNTVLLSEYGGSLQFSIRTINLSFQGSYHDHNRLFMRDNQLYSDWWNMSLSAQGISGDVHWWFESALDKELNFSGIAGADVYLDKTLGLSVLARCLSPDYYSFHGNVFGEGGSTSNEQGMYLGLILNPGGDVSIRSYIDVFRFQAPVYNTISPSDGWEYLCQIEGEFDKNIEWLVKFKYEEKVQNMNGTPVPKKNVSNKYDGKLGFFYGMPDFSFKSVLQFSKLALRDEHEFGWMFYQDAKTAVLNEKFKLNARVAFFYTPSYATRLYAYEHDVLYAFSVPAYYGKGLRYAFNLTYKFNRRLTGYVKYAYTLYSDRDKISSGFSEINGNSKSELKFQIRYRI